MVLQAGTKSWADLASLSQALQLKKKKQGKGWVGGGSNSCAGHWTTWQQTAEVHHNSHASPNNQDLLAAPPPIPCLFLRPSSSPLYCSSSSTCTASAHCRDRDRDGDSSPLEPAVPRGGPAPFQFPFVLLLCAHSTRRPPSFHIACFLASSYLSSSSSDPYIPTFLPSLPDLPSSLHHISYPQKAER